MILEKSKELLPIYSAWIGKSVVLLLVVRQCQLPLPCSIVGESVTDVRIRINFGWEIEVPKELILAVEESTTLSNSQMTEDSTLLN